MTIKNKMEVFFFNSKEFEFYVPAFFSFGQDI